MLWIAIACGLVPLAGAPAQTLDRIAGTKTVRIGFVADQAPFALRSDSGAPRGYAVDLCGRIVEDLEKSVGDVQTTYVETTLGDGFAAVAADRLEFFCSAITITLERRELVDFSEPIFLTGASAVLRKDSPRDMRELFLGERTISPPRSLELRPFARSRVGVRTDTSTETVLRRAIAEGGYQADIVSFPSHDDGLAALEKREIDAYFADRALLLGALDNRDSSNLILADSLLTREAYGIAMKRGDSDLRLAVDRSLSRFYAGEEFPELLARYFGERSQVIRVQIQKSATLE